MITAYVNGMLSSHAQKQSDAFPPNSLKSEIMNIYSGVFLFEGPLQCM